MTSEPPPIDGVRRSYVEARGVRFHVTEAGPADGRPGLALHGWPQHHWVYRDLLADPPPGLRIIAPDLPGYGWSGPAPHKWAKDDVAGDVLALLDALGLDRVLLVGHDWGGFVGYLMVLGSPERFDGYLALNMAHPWVTPRVLAPHLWRFWYQVVLATVGVPLQQRTKFIDFAFKAGSAVDPATPVCIPTASATQWVRAPAETLTARSCCARYPAAHEIPRRGARRCRFAHCLAPATPPSIRR
jgi:pimeloyl-ACP methyl ester carboxylesterase